MSFLFLDLVGPRGLGLGLWANVGIGNSLSNKLYLKVADLAALDGNYYKSIENYEKVAKGAVNSITTGHEAAELSGELALNALRLCEAERQSIASGKIVDVA